MGIDKIGTRKVVQREKYGKKSEAQKMTREMSGARKVRLEKWGMKSGVI